MYNTVHTFGEAYGVAKDRMRNKQQIGVVKIFGSLTMEG
jgi:hypothetical protein